MLFQCPNEWFGPFQFGDYSIYPQKRHGLQDVDITKYGWCGYVVDVFLCILEGVMIGKSAFSLIYYVEYRSYLEETRGKLK